MTNVLDNQAMQTLSGAGAQCGNCGDEPGDRTCPDCERCYQRYVKALRAAGWAPRAEVLREGADALATLRDTTDVNVAEYPRYDGHCRSALNDGIARLRSLADQPTL